MPAETTSRYMSFNEYDRLRRSAGMLAALDAGKGRVRGVTAWMVVDLATSTGLRVGEMANLTVGDVDFRRKLLRVKRLKRKPPAEQALPIEPDLADHLFEYVKWKYRRGESIEPGAPLLCGKRGAMTTRGLQRVWHRARELAGLPREYSIRTARHTLAVRELRRTGDLHSVQQRLGHASPGTTANMYLAVCRDRIDQPAGVG